MQKGDAVPALVEVEVVRRDLEKEIVGRRIKDADVRPGSNAMKVIRRHGRRKELQELLAGAKVESIGRIGRWLVLHLDNEKSLVFDLDDAGLLLKTSASDGIATHTHLVLSFTIGGQLRFVDKLRSGEVFVAPTTELEEMKSEQGFQIDPLEQQVTWQHFSALLVDRDTPLKQLLTDTSFICGLGDVYSDEILFTSGLRHDRPSNKLSSSDVRRLYRALMEVLQDALRARGTTQDEEGFKDLQGIPGQYQLELKVFEREGEPCRRCRSAIVREESNGYVTYFCPQCQS